MGKCDVFQLSYDDVCELCIRYSRGNSNIFKNSKEISSRFLKSATKIGVLGVEINNLFKHFNVDINGSLNSQLGVLHVRENHEEFEETVFPRCQKKHLAMDFPLDSLTICGIYDLKHSTDCFPSLPRMKESYQRYLGVSKKSPQQPWKPWPTCMVQNSIPPFPYSHDQSLSALAPW